MNSEQGVPPDPAKIARHVEMLTNGDAALGVGELPLWNRLEKPPVASPRWAALIRIAGWSVTLGLLAAALLRVFYHDRAILLIWINAFTTYVYLPAYAVLAAAIWKRWWWLAAASIVVIAFHVRWVGADFRPAIPYRAPAASVSSSPVRIFYANVLASNGQYQAIVDEIAAADPDVVVLVEYRHHLAAFMRTAPEVQQYVHGTDVRGPYAGDVAVFSRLPVSRQQVAYIAGRRIQIVDLRIGGQSLRLFAVHSHRPLMEAPNAYERYWEEIDPLIAESTGPTVVIGDFNATQHSLVMNRLASERFRSAHVDRGRSYATTWPNGRLPLPPIRIDQALLSPDVECVDIDEGVGTGSDHKPLVLDIRIHGESTHPDPSAAVRPNRDITADRVVDSAQRATTAFTPHSPF